MSKPAYQSDPKLCAEIAEKVMGWRKTKSGAFKIPGHRNHVWFSPDVYIADAMRVIEKLREAPPRTSDGQCFISIESPDPNITHDCAGKDNWTVSFETGSGYDKLTAFWVCAPTLPLAICRAALRAVQAKTRKGR